MHTRPIRRENISRQRAALARRRLGEKHNLGHGLGGKHFRTEALGSLPAKLRTTIMEIAAGRPLKPPKGMNSADFRKRVEQMLNDYQIGGLAGFRILGESRAAKVQKKK